MASDPFKFNSNAKYKPGSQKDWARELGNPSKGRIQVKYNDPNAWFEADYPDVFEKYKLPRVNTKEMMKTWNTNQMQFWQNQLNFAVWCATTGCGVSYEDHLFSRNYFVRSFYRFHLYYQVRCILIDMHVKQPQDEGWDAMNNSYSTRAYEKICNEFGVSHNTNWRVDAVNNGLGEVYFHPTHYDHLIPIDSGGHWKEDGMSFKNIKGHLTVNYLEQDFDEADKAWRTFIMAKSKGFTKAGVIRIDDSIRTYVWAILSAQVQTHANIIGKGPALDAQKQFLVIIENDVSNKVGIPSSIARYQKDLDKASSVINFSFGVGLYMAPSDMLLRIGRIKGYNNLVVIATDDQPVGLHEDLNKTEAPENAENETGEEGIAKPGPEPVRNPVARHYVATRIRNTDHEDEKIALVVAGVAAGLVAFWFLH